MASAAKPEIPGNAARIGMVLVILAGGVLPRAQAAIATPTPVEGPFCKQPGEVRAKRAQPVATDADGDPRRVSEILVAYVYDNPGHPAFGDVLEATVQLTPTTTGYAAPRPGEPVVTLRLADLPALEASEGPVVFYDSALAAIAPAIVARLQELGLVGVYAEPDPGQLRVEDGVVVDARGPDDTSLTFLITTGVVTEVRSVGLGERLPETETLNHEVHERIRANSPIQPGGRESRDSPSAPDPVSGNLLRSDALDRYVMHLNRHPGRRVDVAVSAGGDEFGAVTLDYLVTENRPWLLFAQLANNGTDATSDWRERFGFIHNQLTNHDDILSVEYVTASFEDVNSLVASYERPLEWDRLRGRAFASWYEYTASDLGQPNADFDGDGWGAGGEIIFSAFQQRETFVDLVGGARLEGVRVDNALGATSGQENVVVLYTGLRLERLAASTSTFGTLMLEGSADGVDGDEVNTLGRTDADEEWATITGSISHSFYIEPLIDPATREAQSLAHEVALSGRFQTSLDNRLIPNYQQVLGGLYTVRGYPESIVAGDSMWLASAEYRWHVPRSLSPRPQAGEFWGRPFRYRPQYEYGPTDWDLVLKAFFDVGGTENADALSFEQSHTLAGAGVGAEVAWTRRVNLRVDLGWALQEVESGDVDVDPGDFEAHVVFTVVF